jgi:YHS domain-containing protein
MLGLLQKHCPICGMDMDKNTTIKRFGKYFCSEEHANQYAEIKMVEERRRAEESRDGFGCC